MQAEAERFVLRPFLAANEHSEQPRASSSSEAPGQAQLGSRKSLLARGRTKSILECAILHLLRVHAVLARAELG